MIIDPKDAKWSAQSFSFPTDTLGRDAIIKFGLDTCCRVMVLTLPGLSPAPRPTPHNIQKGRQSFQENASLPPTSPDDFLRFFGASWAFCAEFLFYTHDGRVHDDGEHVQMYEK